MAEYFDTTLTVLLLFQAMNLLSFLKIIRELTIHFYFVHDLTHTQLVENNFEVHEVV